MTDKISETRQLEIMFNKKFNNSKAIFKNDQNLIGKRRIFSKYMHDKYDIPAREKIKKVLGDIICDNPDIYQQDMIIKSDMCKYKYLELQVCADWVNDRYPYPNLFVYERKAKYGNDTLYLTMSKFLRKGKLFDRKSFSNKPRRLKKYSREFVYDIPDNKVIDVYIDHLDEATLAFY